MQGRFISSLRIYTHSQVEITELIRTLAAKHLAEIIAIRRHLHSEPELSFKEFKTSEYVRHILLEKVPGITIRKAAGTGLIACITGNGGSKVIALRADMDALPISEQNDVSYKSKNQNIMHACGHDVHMASLLGTAMILGEIKEHWKGVVELIFQPGEERLPGGASMMINEGALNDPAPEYIFAQHVFPPLEAGKTGFRKGAYMASCDEIYLTIGGKGGHAAMRGTYINPILIASRVLLALEEKFMLKPLNSIPTVLSFGNIQGNGATNVIPQEVKLEGTFRTMNEEWRNEAHRIINDTVCLIAGEMGGNCLVRIEKGYPALVNDDKATGIARHAAEIYLGKENVTDLEKSMTSEDFSFYSQVKPACFYRLGTGNKAKGIVSGVHTPTFNIDENALETGMGLMAYIAFSSLRES